MTDTKAKAALYLRSSKDRNDVSISAQRRELHNLAAERGFPVVEEFADVVESGKDEHRRGFQDLLAAIRRPSRGWNTLLLLDTSRLSRRRHISVIFEEVECRKHGVRVIYKSLPETDPITDMLLKSVLQAMDEWHSLTSRRKGLAGMAENVRQGFRAGGRAPMGYQIERIATGAMREGAPVMKSKLVPNADAPKVKKFLTARATGMSRTLLLREMAWEISDTTLISMEWNALTYAGHTVWNVNKERDGSRYRDGRKRRPRSAWVIQHDTHPALITTAEAEAIIQRLETSSPSNSRRTPADYLLTGVLQMPDGTAWHGDGAGKYYRAGKGRKISAADVDQTVLRKIVADFRSDAFATRLARESRSRTYTAERAEIELLRAQIGGVDSKIEKFLDMAAEMQEPRAVLRKVEALEKDRRRVEKEIEKAEAELREVQAVASLNDRQIRALLDNMAEDLAALDRERLKDSLRGMVRRIVLDPTSLTCRIYYDIPVNRGDRVASPGRDDAIPHIKTMGWAKVA